MSFPKTTVLCIRNIVLFSNEYCREEDCALYPSCLNGLIQLVLNLNSMAAIAYLSFPKTPKEEMNS